MDLFQGHIISEKVDIWALGVILFKLAFFQTPFEDNKGNVDAGAILKGLGDRKVGGGRVVGCGSLLLRIFWGGEGAGGEIWTTAVVVALWGMFCALFLSSGTAVVIS